MFMIIDFQFIIPNYTRRGRAYNLPHMIVHHNRIRYKRSPLYNRVVVLVLIALFFPILSILSIGKLHTEIYVRELFFYVCMYVCKCVCVRVRAQTYTLPKSSVFFCLCEFYRSDNFIPRKENFLSYVNFMYTLMRFVFKSFELTQICRPQIDKV